MTAAIASRAAGAATAGRAGGTAVRSGPVTDAERATLARKIAAAQGKQTSPPASAPPAAAAPPAKSRPKPTPAPASPGPSTTPSSSPPATDEAPRARFGESLGQSAAGLIVGLLVWGWIILPLIRGGPTEVKATLRAKFTNKTPDGKWLP